MLVPLAASAAMLVLLGGLTVWPAIVVYVDGRDDGADTHDAHAHNSSIGWLLLLPLMALALVAPTPLGADAARRDIGRSAPPPAEVEFGPLPASTGGAVELPVSTFVSRARYDRHHAIAGVSVRLTGFVVRDPAISDGYLLTRFALVCCASDAFASQVRIQGLSGPPPPDDTWVEVVGEAIAPHALDSHEIPALRLQSQTLIDAPVNPYE
jgi:uncharacterized repeat protein (TIGR03943 family)